MTVTLEIRETVGGKRRYVKPNKKKFYPPDTTYALRYTDPSTGKRRRPEFHAPSLDSAMLRRAEKEMQLLRGVPAGTTPEAPKEVLLADAIAAYIAQISKPDKNGELRPAKSITSATNELEKFRLWSGKTYVRELTRGTMEAFRDELNLRYEPDTTYNKLLMVTTFLKRNPLAPTPQLLPITEFPDKKVTIPDPYTEEEFNAMQALATYDEGLLMYAFATTGFREQETAHSEREDINWELGEITIRKKAEYKFRGKNRSARRTTALTPELLAEFELRPPGLLFRNANTERPEGHFLRIVKRIALAAGVTPSTAKKHLDAVKDDWCHRFRDTFISNELYKCKNEGEKLLLCARVGHANTEMLNKYFGKLKNPYTPQLRQRKAAKVVKMVRSA
jgi:hypothetical protein